MAVAKVAVLLVIIMTGVLAVVQRWIQLESRLNLLPVEEVAKEPLVASLLSQLLLPAELKSHSLLS
jgi:hypothetical protein